MTTISISLPDELVYYLDQKVEDKNLLIISILQQWQRQQEDQELAQACSIIDELDLGWTEECQTSAIMDLFEYFDSFLFSFR
jgi:antitoxin ParD1/3/4